jgi:hypothetical protein
MTGNVEPPAPPQHFVHYRESKSLLDPIAETRVAESRDGNRLYVWRQTAAGFNGMVSATHQHQSERENNHSAL